MLMEDVLMHCDLGGASQRARSPKRLEICRVGGAPGEVRERVVLPIHSGRDPIALLLEAAEELCLTPEGEGVARIDAGDVRAFVIPRLRELLDPRNDELQFVLSAGGGEKVSEHTIRRAIAKGVWPTNGSVTLEAAVLAVKVMALATEASKHDESLVIRRLEPGLGP